MAKNLGFNLAGKSGNLIAFLCPGTFANQTGFGMGLQDSVWPGLNAGGKTALSFASGSPSPDALIIGFERGRLVLKESNPENFTLEAARSRNPSFINWAFGPLGTPNKINAGNNLNKLLNTSGSSNGLVAIRMAEESLEQADIYSDSRISSAVAKANGGLGLPSIPPYWTVEGFRNLISGEDPTFRDKLLTTPIDKRGQLIITNSVGTPLNYAPTFGTNLVANRGGVEAAAAAFDDKKLVIREIDKPEWTKFFKYVAYSLKKYKQRGCVNIVGLLGGMIEGFFRPEIFTGGMINSYYTGADMIGGILDYAARNNDSSVKTPTDCFNYLASMGLKLSFDERSDKGISISTCDVMNNMFFTPAINYFNDSSTFFADCIMAEDINVPTVALLSHQTGANFNGVYGLDLTTMGGSPVTDPLIKYQAKNVSSSVTSFLNTSRVIATQFDFDTDSYGCQRSSTNNWTRSETYNFNETQSFYSHAPYMHWPLKQYQAGKIQHKDNIDANCTENATNQSTDIGNEPGVGMSNGIACCPEQYSVTTNGKLDGNASRKTRNQLRLPPAHVPEEWEYDDNIENKATSTADSQHIYTSQGHLPPSYRLCDGKSETRQTSSTSGPTEGQILFGPRVAATNVSNSGGTQTVTIVQTGSISDESSTSATPGGGVTSSTDTSTAKGNFISISIGNLSEPLPCGEFVQGFFSSIVGDCRWSGGDYVNNRYTEGQGYEEDANGYSIPGTEYWITKNEKSISEVFIDLPYGRGDETVSTYRAAPTIITVMCGTPTPFRDKRWKAAPLTEGTAYRYNVTHIPENLAYFYSIILDVDGQGSCQQSALILSVIKRYPNASKTGYAAYIRAQIPNTKAFYDKVSIVNYAGRDIQYTNYEIVEVNLDTEVGLVLPAATPAHSQSVVITAHFPSSLTSYLNGLKDNPEDPLSGVANQMLQQGGLVFYDTRPPKVLPAGQGD